MASKPKQFESSRRDNLAKSAEIKDICLKIYESVRKGFEDQAERSDQIQEYWNIYNCKLGNNQYYTGNTKIFVPIVHDAVKARVTRFCNQIFPKTGRYVDVLTGEADLPHARLALAEHYVRMSHLRSLMPALIKNGDVEGHYHLYVDWNQNTRYITRRVQNPLMSDDEMVEDPDNTHEDIEEFEVKIDNPNVEIIADPDIVILPSTAASLDDAIDAGGSVTIMRRWSKTKIKEMIKKKEIDKKAGELILDQMSRDQKNEGKVDKEKDMVDAAGIRRDGRGQFCQVYETWAKLPVDDEKKICRIFLAGPDQILSAKRNPLWCDRLPIISAPVEKVQGVFKGKSLLENGVKDIQYYANDIINESADSSAYAMMPIVMTDPEKNPRIGSMVLAMAAIWQTSPKDTTFAQFPPLWKDGLEILANCRQQIFQSLSVNPAQITNQPNSKQKRNQAEIANEQQVDILTTADAVSVLEEGILSPLVTLFMEMDHQYRDKEVSVRQYGELGRMANIEDIPPLQMDRRFSFIWLGVEAARNQQQMQTQISALNVLKSLPPQSYQGYKLDLAPAIVNLVESIFGPRIGPQLFKDIRSQLSQDPEKENEMMLAGVDAMVHPLDDHQKHLQVHIKALPLDMTNQIIQRHVAQHQQAMAAAMTAQAEQMQPKGMPGSPGGAGRGAAGTPRPGAQQGPPKPMQQPAGAIHKDRMPLAMPRKM